jgi:adenylyltransferase/sulfurtransferase
MLARLSRIFPPARRIFITQELFVRNPMPATLDQPTLPKLTNEEIARYSRHLILPEVGMEGQQKLKAAKVLCVGTGGLGAPMALYLAAAGVGTIGLLDFDVVDESNLQRQIIHTQATVGKLKVDSAEIMLNGLNKNTTIVKHNTMLTSANALEIFKDYDVIADGTDNFQTRYLVNDACVLTGKPNVYGSIFRFEGQASVFATEEGPCYRCLYPEPPPPGLVPSCAEGGVLGILPGLVGVIQATEVIKLILGIGEPLIGRLLLVDALGMGFRTMKLRKNPECPMCGTHEIKELIDYDQFCGIPKPMESGPLEVSSYGGVADLPVVDGIPQMTVEQLKQRIDAGTAPFVLDVREPHEYAIVDIGAPLIPVGELTQNFHRLTFPKTTEIVVHCKSGARSQRAALILKENGYTNVSNLSGGILAWADRIDPSLPKY